MKQGLPQISCAVRILPLWLAFLLVLSVLGAAPGTTLPSTAVTPSACNSVAFHQIPDHSERLVGRHLLNVAGDCSGSRFTLALYAIDWASGHISPVRDLITLPIATAAGGIINTAYDPSVIRIGGTLSIAFECSGTGPGLDGVASSCMATLDPKTYRIIPSTLHVVVAGVRGSTAIDGFSASVPKLFVYRGRPYLYWTVVQLVASGSGQFFGPINTRGAALARGPGPSSQLWVAGSIGHALATNDRALSVEVLGVVPGNPMLSGVADSFDVKPVGGRLLLTVGVGGQACTTPVSVAYGCYRFQIRAADRPLGYHIYNSQILNPSVLPKNPTEYSIFVDTVADGHIRVLGRYFVPNVTGSAKSGHSFGDGMRYYDIGAASRLRFLAADPTPLPSPVYAAQSLTPEFDSLKRFMPTCSSISPVPNPGETSCFAATARYCANQGYGAGGLLLDIFKEQAGVVCLRSGAQRLTVAVPALAALEHGCGADNPVSLACAGAIDAYCASRGYAGGFGPTERAGGTMIVTCVSAKLARIIPTSFATLQLHQGSCREDGWTSSLACTSAVASVCRALGYEAGFGIVRRSGEVAYVGCLRKNADA